MEKYNRLAGEAIRLSETKLLSRLRFLSGAVTAVRYECGKPDCRIASDGKTIYYDPRQILQAYKAEPDSIAADLLHVLLHCLMGHPFCPQKRDSRMWNLACDIAAEGARIEMSAHFAPVRDDRLRKNQVARICDYAKGSAAEMIYNYLMDACMPEEELSSLEALFGRDDHRLWRTSADSGKGTPTGKVGKGRIPESEEAPWREEASEEEQQEEDSNRERPGEPSDDSGVSPRDIADYEKLRESWKKTARQARTELTLFGKRQGTRAARLLNGIKPFLTEEMDYSAFLRIFAAENEVMKVSDEEFDVIYYTYGLERYGNIALIEPLEYSSQNRIREFVIAIDTSGSVQGELVEEFLRRTCHVLKQTESFADRVNIYLIQCDARIQSCTRITSLGELEAYIGNLELSGFGGTDFRPVFTYVEELLEARKIQKLNGLLYFTDGIGSYPQKEPPYKTAFIFHRDDYISPNVPEWAIKAVLTSDNIKMMKDRL